MDAMYFFLPLHELMHGQITDRFSQLTDAQMRLRPHPNMNSIAWLLWHIARSEDMGQSADRQSPRCPCQRRMGVAPELVPPRYGYRDDRRRSGRV